MSTRGVRLPGDQPGDKAHRVEILGQGQQLVAYGIHPDTGKPYTWNGSGDPVKVPMGLLPPITLQGVRDFLVAAEAMLLEVGQPFGKLSDDDDRRQRVERDKPADDLRAADAAMLRSALAAIPNADCDCDDWQRVGMAIKGALGDNGRQDFLAWSAKSVKDVPDTSARAWESFDPKRIGAGTIFYLAEHNGWTRQGRAAGVQLDDFHAYMPMHSYIFVPEGEMWPAASVNARLPAARQDEAERVVGSAQAGRADDVVSGRPGPDRKQTDRRRRLDRPTRSALLQPLPPADSSRSAMRQGLGLGSTSCAPSTRTTPAHPAMAGAPSAAAAREGEPRACPWRQPRASARTRS